MSLLILILSAPQPSAHIKGKKSSKKFSLCRFHRIFYRLYCVIGIFLRCFVTRRAEAPVESYGLKKTKTQTERTQSTCHRRSDFFDSGLWRLLSSIGEIREPHPTPFKRHRLLGRRLSRAVQQWCGHRACHFSVCFDWWLSCSAHVQGKMGIVFPAAIGRPVAAPGGFAADDPIG